MDEPAISHEDAEEINGEKTFSLESALDSIGFGLFQVPFSLISWFPPPPAPTSCLHGARVRNH